MINATGEGVAAAGSQRRAVAGSDSIILFLLCRQFPGLFSALDYIRFKFLFCCNHHHCREIKAVAVPVDAVSLIALGLLSLL
ncbi:uncharacterized protein DS421_17g588590 [Arachis hypogaea]|nr:uncharacterized protein DS421_17g588590 [Arachis hypogaea]